MFGVYAGLVLGCARKANWISMFVGEATIMWVPAVEPSRCSRHI